MLDEPTQLAVIRGLQRGSRDAWTALYDNYSVAVWQYAGRLLGPHTAAVADVVQETFLEAAASARNFDSDRGTIWSWLTGIVHHRVSAHWRQTNRTARLRQLAPNVCLEAQNALNDGQTIETAAQQRELAEFVRCVLAQLPAEYAALLTAKYLDDASLQELSLQWNSSVEAIKSKLARARREFRGSFAKLSENQPSSTHN
ncbi:MAG TPA: sigma-70 family RNA polymerase sigma factor [Pirellulales bacterium]